MSRSPRNRADAFCARYNLQLPVLLAPMAGACPPRLSIAVANAGSMGAMGALMNTPAQIREWVSAFRSGSRGPLQLNTWVGDPPPRRDPRAEERVRQWAALATETPAGELLARIWREAEAIFRDA